MKNKLNKIIEDIAPPLALRIYRDLVTGNRFVGNYATWETALKASAGYDSNKIIDKVKDASLKVKRGEAAYERDSVLFDQIEYSWPLLAALLWVASIKESKLNLVDFGGSLGSSYYQNAKFLSHLREVRWNIVEQGKFVEIGRCNFEDEHVKFYHSLDACVKDQHPDTLLLSGVIQYVAEPYALLEQVRGLGFEFIIFDRTPFLEKGNDRITVQKVPHTIYEASYPAWFFNRDRFMRFWSQAHELIAEFDALAGCIHLGAATAIDKGFIFRKK